MIKQIVEDRRFAFADLCLVLFSGLVGMYAPIAGLWCIPILLIPWLLRMLTDTFQIKRTPLDGLIFVFLLTAAASTYSAYDQAAALQKFYFIFLAILLYYSLVHQPHANRENITWLFFGLGVAMAGYFFLTHDFVNNPRDIALINSLGAQWMSIRPQFGWAPLPSGHVAGLSVLPALLILYRFVTSYKLQNPPVVVVLVLTGSVVVLLAVVFTTSTSVWVALISATGILVLWLLRHISGLHKVKNAYPWLVLVFLLCFTIAIYVLGADPSSNPGKFGINNRLEVFIRSLYLLGDFPIWGGGLTSFSGLYSQYILNIPYHFFQDSYNTFLDVMIEQGIFGGLALIFIYLISIYIAARKLQSTNRRSYMLVLFLLIFTFGHAIMQDYLYVTPGIMFLLLPPAMLGMFLKPSDVEGMMQRKALSIRAATGFIFIVLLSFFIFPTTRNKLIATWYANLGSVQLEQVQLAGFPNVGWLGLKVVPSLYPPEDSLQTAFQLDPQNLTASYRLGLIYMLRRDFASAEPYLETAYILAPDHRGVLKSLGYCHLWQGELAQAQQLLSMIPETREELDAYQYWWLEQDRADLSGYTMTMIQRIDLSTAQP